jgi:8-oxo-dGTP pyrophosphatase MutT (NUDIX family)
MMVNSSQAAAHRGPWPPGSYPPVPASVTKICDNESVGVIVADDHGRYLLFRRARPPVGIAPVAGHVDDHASVEDAARAEVAEEVGLAVTALTPLIVRWRRNICRRRHGPLGPGHNWTVYRAQVAGTLTASPDEARDAQWYSLAELAHLAERTVAHARGELTAAQFAANPGIEPVWLDFLHQLGFVRVNPADLAAVDQLASQSPYQVLGLTESRD